MSTPLLRFCLSSCALGSLLALSACSASPDLDEPLLGLADDVAERSYPPTFCGEPNDGELPEYYVFDAIDEQLDRDEGLRDFTGFESVDDCEDAREFVRLKNEYEAELDESEAESPLEDLPIELSPRIANGSSSSFRPSVEIGVRYGSGFGQRIFCTGFIIGPREIVTAAHCIPYEGRRPIQVTVRETLSGGSVTNTCVANCSDARVANARGYRHPHYTGSGDVGDDVGVIVVDHVLQPPASLTSYRVRMMETKTWKNAPISVYGWGNSSHAGTGGGVAREGTMTVSWTGSKHFTANATHTRACNGDSGGPAVRVTSGDFPLTVGVESGMGGPRSEECPYSDGFNRWVHLGPKIPWIEDKINRTCTRFGSATNPAITYKRCW